MEKLRIAQIANIAERVPPPKYGGTERVIYTLTEELVKRGHDVTLFATGDSQTSAKLESVQDKPLREVHFENSYGPNIVSLRHIGRAYQMQDQFDIIHDHNGYISLPTANLAKVPVVMTLHGAISKYEREIFEEHMNPYLVTISNAQREPASDLNYIGNVYHGLNMEHFPFSDTDDGYLLFVGRISEEKGVHIAIDVAQRLDLPLIIAAKLNSIEDSPKDVAYFRQYVEPKLSSQIRWIGEVDEVMRNGLMSKARCLLHTITWREPFGLTLIESMACGAPVVAFGEGSIPEIVRVDETGFVVEDLQEMVEAVQNIEYISRFRCRQYALDNFTPERMTDGYEAIYQKILNKERGISSSDLFHPPMQS